MVLACRNEEEILMRPETWLNTKRLAAEHMQRGRAGCKTEELEEMAKNPCFHFHVQLSSPKLTGWYGPQRCWSAISAGVQSLPGPELRAAA